MGSGTSPQVMTLANSIIGVSILAMPFCFKQCGILLSILILVLSSILTRLSCHYILKSAIMSRRRNFELLAFHVFGNGGKIATEISIILQMIGMCIAFFVVIGDLGPTIIASMLDFKSSVALRPSVLIGLALFVVLPLGMLRNVDSLSTICTASFLFYLALLLKIFCDSLDNLLSPKWIGDVHYWRPSGILQCLPIFSMALFCQTTLFEVFESSPNISLDRMNIVVKSAINLCTLLYISVGFFGYIAFYNQPFTGNILMNFTKSAVSDMIKFGFVLSVAVSFPLIIFPCRASLNSLFFKKIHLPHYELVTGGGNYIPEVRFKCITLFIITCSLTIGLLAPNIEIVLGLLGSTIGVIISLFIPPLIFIKISSKATTERMLAQVMCIIGIFIMVMGTYANIYFTQIEQNENLQKLVVAPPQLPINEADSKIDAVINEPGLSVKSDKLSNVNKSPDKAIEKPPDEMRKEPPVPEAPEIIAQNVAPPPIVEAPKDVKLEQQVDKKDVVKKDTEPVKEKSIDPPKKKTIDIDKIKKIMNDSEKVKNPKEEIKIVNKTNENKNGKDEGINNKENVLLKKEKIEEKPEEMHEREKRNLDHELLVDDIERKNKKPEIAKELLEVKKAQTESPSIIITPNRISEPKIVLKDQLEKHTPQHTDIKPMKRELKSVENEETKKK